LIGRLQDGWQEDHTKWKAQCILVLSGATPEGKKELVGYRWRKGKCARLAARCST
jgi:hypothetical protein